MSHPTPTTATASADQLPPESVPLTRGATIELDTDQAIHIPHVDPSAAAAAASSSYADDSEPLSEEAEEDDQEVEEPEEHKQRLDTFLDQLKTAARTGAPESSGEEDVFSESEQRTEESNAAAAAAVADIQAFLNRQQAEHEQQQRAAESSSPSAADAAAAKAAALAAHKAHFRAQMEERRRAAAEAEENQEDDETAGQHEQEEDEEEDEEEEEPVDESFVGWLKSYASDALSGKSAHAIKHRSKWLTGLALSYSVKALYVVGTLAVCALPGFVAELNEVTTTQRMARCQSANIPTDVKAYIWTGAPSAGVEPNLDGMALQTQQL